MNQHLQSILNFIQQSKHLSDEEKDTLLKAAKDANKELEITSFKLDRTEKVKKTTAVLLEKTIEELEKKRKDVEAQSKELEVQNALEKIRAVALSMKEPADMLEICSTISHQLQSLNVKEIRNVQTAIFYESKGTYMNYEYYAKHDKTFITETSYTNHKMHQEFAAQMLKGKGEFFTTYISKAELPDWIAYQKTTNVFIDDYLNTAPSLNYYWYSLGAVALGISTYEPLNEEDINLFKRFLKVFELSYTRYLDIEQAIAQARESQIQLALERVRARTMAMQKSEELTEAALLLFEQLQSLGAALWSCGFNIWEKGKTECTSFIARGGKMLPPVKLFLNENSLLQLFNESRQKGEEFWFMELTGEDSKSVVGYVAKQRQLQTGDNVFLSEVTLPSSQIVHLVNFSNGNLMFITLEPRPEFHDIFKRFTNVFEQTYTRFLDLQKAEAQAREAQIEAALEKVRSRSLAVHKSDEFIEVIKVVFEKLQELGIIVSSVSINTFIEGSKDTEVYICGQNTGELSLSHFRLLYFDHPISNDRFNAQQSGLDFFSKNYGFEEKNSFFKYLFEISDLKYMPDDIKKMVFQTKSYTVSVAIAKHSIIVVNDFDGKALSEKEIDTVKRFSKVFEQAYIRFLDLQKAEAQAREAQIEAALEKVRSRSLAMHTSNELQEVVTIVFDKLTDLNIKIDSASVIVLSDKTDVMQFWVAVSGQQYSTYFQIPHFDNTKIARDFNKARESGKNFTKSYTGKEKNEQWYYLFEHSDLKNIPDDRKKALLEASAYTVSVMFTNNTALQLLRNDEEVFSENENKIFQRFANVFEQAYIRFLDLKKAEEQTREAQIELGLERVRARAMAMQTSEELNPLIGTVFTELTKLDLLLTRCVILIYEGNEKGVRWWMANSETPSTPMNFFVKYIDMPFFNEYFKGWYNRSLKWQYCLEGENKIKTDDFLFTETELSLLPDFVIAGMRAPNRVYLNASFNNFGNLTLASLGPLSEEHFNILLRFAKVFDLTYTRFNDLQKAEAQTRESQIQLALERVRARTMAMQKSNELSDAVYVLFQQFKDLGEKPDQATIGVINESEKVIEYWVTMYGNPINKVFKFSLDEPNVTNKIYKAWKENKKSLMIDLSGDALTEFMTYRAAKGGAAINPDEKRRIINVAFFSKGLLNVQSNEERSEESIKLLERFAAVFDQTYTRFLDLKNAEAQAREAQIETALERVRSRSMGMQKSEELKEIIQVVYEQFVHLNILVEHAGFIMDYKERNDMHIWLADKHTVPFQVIIPYFDCAHWNSFNEAKKTGKNFFANHLSFEEKNKFYQDLFKLFPVPDEAKEYYLTCAGLAISTVLMDNVALYIENFSGTPYTDEENAVLMRFGKVFQQTYTRFLDLEKAEAQAREAQIEASLERVRSKTMAMHNSTDVGDTVATMFDELVKLGIETMRCGIGIMQGNHTMELWTAKPGTNGKIDLVIGQLDMSLHPLLQGAYNGWKNKKESFSYELKDDDLINYYTMINNYSDYPIKYDISTLPSKIFHNDFYFTEGSLYVFSSQPLPEETSKIFRRFSAVFGQTYRRYQDLQKAEAAAREAQIEAALERVRSSTMAMHKSDDLAKTAVVLFAQLNALGNMPDRISIGIINESEGVADMWLTDQSDNEIDSRFILNLNEKTTVQKLVRGWKAGLKSMTVDLTGDELKTWLNYVRKLGLTVKDKHFKNRRVHNVAFFSHGWLNISVLEPLSGDMINILERFAAVYSLTYRRFLDLQKAEAQTREAQIEAALERVRGKAMAMQNSNDLSIAASMVFTELRKLGINPIRCGVGILNKESRKAQLYSATSSADGDSLALVGWVTLSNHPVLENIYDTWLKNEDYYPELSGTQLKSYYELLLTGLSVTAPDWQSGEKQYGHFLPFSVGCLYAWANVKYNDDEIKILKRFAAIVDLTFRRYFELQTSETNAREAIKQAALDRIRADIASMRTVNDLNRITPLIWNELNILGIPFIRCGVFIMNDEQQLIYTFLSTPDGEAIAAFHIPYDTPGNIKHVISHWHNKKNYIDHWDENAFTEFADTLVTQGALTSPQQYLKTIPHGGFYLHFLPFLQGMLYVGNSTQLGEQEINLIQSVADAFSTAYARYEDFNKLEVAKKQVEKTLVDLKQTQQQLVQSEKMASLGELTAGIAHEIQNPLNFVNNFSEVNEELLIELIDEFNKGNAEEAKAIANDIKQNLEKINHHGKRADAIVKGMLQHSRKNTGQKEPTDINALCDEYLRLSYHGLRAKDKNFNADFKTDFDNSINKINIVPQDIGRVLLNLFNNAFYAVNEKKKLLANSYQPTAEVKTRRINDKVEITVSDNGNGIPKNIIDKIFQPFFTTKPTGEGTGLGLSLAYDIITKEHNGTIKVESEEGEGTTFIIQITV